MSCWFDSRKVNLENCMSMRITHNSRHVVSSIVPLNKGKEVRCGFSFIFTQNLLPSLLPNITRFR
jgi:hypothetical protein